MEMIPLFDELLAINDRPAVYSRMTIASLWTDPHVSKEMLRYHLDPSVSAASDRTEDIDAATAWLTSTFGIGAGSRVLDLGCGPGLYTLRLAGTGATVTGVDFSANSIAYARKAAAEAGLAIDYVEADYLEWQPALPDARFDLITMIMRDYGAMAPAQRLAMARKVASLLSPGGAFVFDLDSMPAYDKRDESASYSPAPNGGFWSAEPYFEFRTTFRYPQDAVTLERFVLFEAERTREIYNWVQFFSPESLATELAAAGLVIDTVLGDVTGRPYDPGTSIFAVVARRVA
jgi:SAM-dependent methyltransferase